MKFRTRRSAISDGTKDSSRNYGCLILFGLVFGGFGSIFVFLFLILPLWRVSSARHWVDVPCTIIESHVGESHDSDGGSTYRVEVRFSYSYNPDQLESDATTHQYESTQYDFTSGTYSSGRSGKKSIVKQLSTKSLGIFNSLINICLKHSNGIGKLKFDLQRFQNKLILNIIDIGSICNKNIENF